MVSQRRNNPGVFETPLTLRVAGRDYTLASHDAVINAVRKLDKDERSLNLQAAQAAFALGMMIIKAAEALGYGHQSHLYNECGIHSRKAERCIRFARHYANDDGTMDLAKYRESECKARNNHENGTRTCRFDRDGHPSVTAVEHAEGLRTEKNTKNEHVFVFDDRAEAAGSDPRVGSGGHERKSMKDILKPLSTAGRLPASHSGARGTGGGQLDIDFDLMAAQARLARSIASAQGLFEHGDITPEQARRIHAALEGAQGVADDIMEHARG
jgi:hypothetical protein